jgi:hypothetical protein
MRRFASKNKFLYQSSEWEVPRGSVAAQLPRGASDLMHDTDKLESEQARRPSSKVRKVIRGAVDAKAEH